MLRLNADVLCTGAEWRGARGSGKTLALSRPVIVPLYVRGATMIVLDLSMGSLTDDAFWCLSRLDPQEYGDLWADVYYCPLGGMGDADARVLGTPFLAPTSPGEPLERRAMRPIDLWLRLSPQLERAPMLGAAKLGSVGRDLLMLAAGMGLELLDVEDMLRRPERYAERARAALRAHPWELAGPVTWYTETYPRLRPDQKQKETDALLARVTPYNRNERLAAQYGGAGWDVPLARIPERQRLLIVVDGRYLMSDGERRLGSAWMFRRVLDVLDSLGPSRETPIFVVIDELALLIGPDNTLMEDDFDRLVQIGRNKRVGVIVGYQEEAALSRRMTQGILPQLGSHFYSSTADHEVATRLATRYDHYNPLAVKASRTQLVTTFMGYERQEGDPIYFSIQEQTELAKRKYMSVPKLTFLAAIAPREGEPPTQLRRVDLQPFVRHFGWPDRGTVDEVRRRLVVARGRRIAEVLDEIHRRRPAGPVPATASLPPAPRAVSPRPPARRVKVADDEE